MALCEFNSPNCPQLSLVVSNDRYSLSRVERGQSQRLFARVSETQHVCIHDGRSKTQERLPHPNPDQRPRKSALESHTRIQNRDA